MYKKFLYWIPTSLVLLISALSETGFFYDNLQLLFVMTIRQYRVNSRNDFVNYILFHLIFFIHSIFTIISQKCLTINTFCIKLSRNVKKSAVGVTIIAHSNCIFNWYNGRKMPPKKSHFFEGILLSLMEMSLWKIVISVLYLYSYTTLCR